MSRPVLYLDVDGVVNALTDGDPADYTILFVEGFVVRVHRQVPDMIAALAEHFDIVWFTLWNEMAAQSIGPLLGLESAPHLETSWSQGELEMTRLGYGRQTVEECLYAKTPLLARHVGRDQRWVWIDDDHGRADFEFLVDRGLDPLHFRLLRTDAQAGLTWDTVGEAIDFATGHGSPVPVPGSRDLHRPGSSGGRAWAVGTERDRQPQPGDTCPQCGARLAPVVYGLPGSDLMEQAGRGEVIIGGCMPMGPRTACTACGWSPRVDPRARW